MGATTFMKSASTNSLGKDLSGAERELFHKTEIKIIKQEKLDFKHDQESKESKGRSLSTGRRYPEKRNKQGRLLFQEIFVKPKQEKLELMLEQHQRSRSQAQRRQISMSSIPYFNKTGIIPKLETETLFTVRKSIEQDLEPLQRRGAIKLRWQLTEDSVQQTTQSGRPKTPLFGNKNVKVSPKMTK